MFWLGGWRSKKGIEEEDKIYSRTDTEIAMTRSSESFYVVDDLKEVGEAFDG